MAPDAYKGSYDRGSESTVQAKARKRAKRTNQVTEKVRFKERRDKYSESKAYKKSGKKLRDHVEKIRTAIGKTVKTVNAESTGITVPILVEEAIVETLVNSENVQSTETAVPSLVETTVPTHVNSEAVQSTETTGGEDFMVKFASDFVYSSDVYSDSDTGDDDFLSFEGATDDDETLLAISSFDLDLDLDPHDDKVLEDVKVAAAEEQDGKDKAGKFVFPCVPTTTRFAGASYDFPCESAGGDYDLYSDAEDPTQTDAAEDDATQKDVQNNENDKGPTQTDAAEDDATQKDVQNNENDKGAGFFNILKFLMVSRVRLPWRRLLLCAFGLALAFFGARRRLRKE